MRAILSDFEVQNNYAVVTLLEIPEAVREAKLFQIYVDEAAFEAVVTKAGGWAKVADQEVETDGELYFILNGVRLRDMYAPA